MPCLYPENSSDDNSGSSGEGSSNSSLLDDIEKWEVAFALIKKEKWGKLRRLLKGQNATQYCTGHDDTGLTVLSYALGSNPPLDVVELLLKVNPSASIQADEYGAVPLHVACLNGASFSVIDLLIRHDKTKSLRIPDHDLRVPLHHAVEFSARLDDTPVVADNSDDDGDLDCGSSASSFEEDLEIIRRLCELAPEMVHYQNKNKDSPIDVAHAIKTLANTPKKNSRIDLVYGILKRTSIQLYQEQKRIWEERGFVQDPKLLRESEVPSMASSEASTVGGSSLSGKKQL